MAIFTLAHEGKNLRQLRNIVRYNSKNKKGFNSNTNPRSIGVHSNCGYCLNIDDENEYKQLVENFILTADVNAQLSTNSCQKYFYEHSVISFSIEDDKKLGMKKATELAIEIAKQYDHNFENFPYMLWPKIDSGKLHFHLVKCYFNEQGKYFKQSFPMKKMNRAIQKIEKNHNLTFTGKNDPSNYIWKTNKDGRKKKIYFPQGNKNNNKIADLKAVIGDDWLSKDNLIKLYDNDIVIRNDGKELSAFIINQLKEHNEDLIIINKLLAQKLSLKDCLDVENPARKALFKKRSLLENSNKIEAKNLKNYGNKQTHKASFSTEKSRNKLRYT